MTDYCTVADVEGWFSNTTFSTDTKITLAKVEQIITRKSAYIDDRIGSKYPTPITGTAALTRVKEICEYLVIADVEAVLKKGLGRTGETTRPIDYNKKAEDMITLLETGESTLLDASETRTNEFANYNEDNDIEPLFERDTTQW